MRRNWFTRSLLVDWLKVIKSCYFACLGQVERNSEFNSKTSIVIRVTTCFFKK
jgi:hypothetical protein